jgi:hypothetical protein
MPLLRILKVLRCRRSFVKVPKKSFLSLFPLFNAILIWHCCRHSAVHGGGQPVREGRELGQGGARLHQVQELEQGGRAARPDHLAQDPRAVRQGQGGRRLLQGGAARLHGGQGVRERDPRAAGAPAEPGGRGAHRARAAVDRGRQDGVLTCILRDEDLIFL